MQQSERIQYLKKRRLYAAKVISLVAKFNYMKNHVTDFDEAAVKNLTRLLKFFLKKLQSAQKTLDLHQNKLSFEEELNRQFLFLKEHLSEVQEKMIVLSELQNLLHEIIENDPPKISKYSSNGKKENNMPEELNSFGKFSEKDNHSSFDSKSSETFDEIKVDQSSGQQNKKNPLLSCFMKEKRISDYRLNTQFLKSPNSKTNSSNKQKEDEKKRKTKLFINSRKSVMFSQFALNE